MNNYTLDGTIRLAEDYKTEKDVNILAQKFGVSVKSILAKLTQMGIYHGVQAKSSKSFYSEEETTQLKELYQTEKDAYVLADKFDKSHRSIISKLVHLGIYEKPEKQRRLTTCKALIADIERLLDITFIDKNMNKSENVEMILDAMKKRHVCKQVSR